MFVSKEPVAISVDGPEVPDEARNIIFIRPRMNVGVQNRVIGQATKIGKKKGEDVTFDVGAYSTALLVENVVSWRGPAFAHVECTPHNIANLDGKEPLVKRVLEEIAARNKDEEEETDPNSPSTSDPSILDGSDTYAVIDLTPQANGAYASTSPTAITGRRTK